MHKPPTIKSQDLFFPLAACHAMLTVPLAVIAMTGPSAWPPALIGAGHGFEMFFGFALTIVAEPVAGRLLTTAFAIAAPAASRSGATLGKVEFNSLARAVRDKNPGLSSSGYDVATIRHTTSLS